jgi:hypothetical protein
VVSVFRNASVGCVLFFLFDPSMKLFAEWSMPLLVHVRNWW